MLLWLLVRAALEAPRTLADKDVDAVRTPIDGGGAAAADGAIILPAALADLVCNDGGGAMLDLPISPPARSMPVLRFAAGSGTAKKRQPNKKKTTIIQHKYFPNLLVS
jgi:hypothetical protein